MAKLTKGEQSLYWGLWSEYKKYLVEEKGWATKDANAFRHELAHRLFGYAISSKDFQRSHLDRWKACIKAHTEPDNVQVQLDCASQAYKRAENALNEIVAQLDYDADSLESMFYRIAKKPQQECDAHLLTKVVIALRMHQRRQPKPEPKRQPMTISDYGQPF